MTDLHLVGGFLGSGKTTAIANAARYLMQQGKRVGVVTNDQGKYLVDTAFMQAAEVPTVEIAGGCFCCHVDDLEDRLQQLEASAQPDVIFAEAIGTCADIVATVIKPLLDIRRTSLSVFADIRLLKRRLEGKPLPFSDNVIYLFDQQLQEAPFIVINKVDLVNATEAQRVAELAQRCYPDKRIRLQQSTDLQSVIAWMNSLQPAGSETRLSLDEARYGLGKQRLGWMDRKLMVETSAGGEQDLRPAVTTLIGLMVGSLRQQGYPVGHVKFWLEAPGVNVKISFTALNAPTEVPGWEHDIPDLAGGQSLTLMVNARAEASFRVLRALLDDAIEHTSQIYPDVRFVSVRLTAPAEKHR